MVVGVISSVFASKTELKKTERMTV
jgi:hypothetical protein